MARFARGAALRHGPRAYAALRGMVTALHPARSKTFCPCAGPNRADASAAFEAGDDIDAGFIDNDASSANQVHVADKKAGPEKQVAARTRSPNQARL